MTVDFSHVPRQYNKVYNIYYQPIMSLRV